MNQSNLTVALILKSSCSCGRYEGSANIKIWKRPQISPWFLLDESRRCGRYGHITRVCCIGGKYMCVFTHIDSYRKTSATSARPHVREVIQSLASTTQDRKTLGMNNLFESRPIEYNGIRFRSRLEAHWACFFDLAEWKWEYQPVDLVGWTPTFRVEFPCGHSECPDPHVLLVEVQHFGVRRPSMHGLFLRQVLEAIRRSGIDTC